MVEIDHQVVTLLDLLYPSWVEVDLEWWLAPSSERLRLCIAPSSERWSLCWICIPLCEEVDCGYLAKCLPLLFEVVFVLPLCEVVLVERGVVYS